jgi:hypothetical protein
MSADLQPLGIAWPTLSHWSDKPLESPRSVEQRTPREDGYVSAFEKPKGLWVSIDGEDDWPAWCKAERFAIERLKYRHVVTLHNPDSMLWLVSHGDLDDFQREFGIRARWGEHAIQWPKVAAKYPGIMIAPYQWSARMEMNWYYGWDCASGCIWNANAIASFECSEHTSASESK